MPETHDEYGGDEIAAATGGVLSTPTFGEGCDRVLGNMIPDSDSEKYSGHEWTEEREAITFFGVTPPVYTSVMESVASIEPSIQLSEQQQSAVDRVQEWFQLHSGMLSEFRLGGYAGTGKTTIIKWIIRNLNCSTAVAAFTGKAVSVLRRKGIGHAQTLHSLLYDFEYDSFLHKFTQTPKTVIPDVDLIVVDEASMVSVELYAQLRRHDIPLLLVGDPAQLEPVGDNPNLMRQVDYTLTEIHRQAAKSPILRLATAIRNGRQVNTIPVGAWKTKPPDAPSMLTVSNRNARPQEHDVTICARNTTRHTLNQIVRKHRGFDPKPTGLDVGETVICLKNDKDHGVYNGMILTVTRVGIRRKLAGDEVFDLELVDDLGTKFYNVPVMTKAFGENFVYDHGHKGIPFDYGYALTAHKSQGSEWGNVLVINERLPKVDHQRWVYTATTRASTELTLCL